MAQAGLVEANGDYREELCGLAAVLAPGAVAARTGELFSEVRREEGGLPAVVGGEGQHLVEAGDFAALPFEGALVERLRQLLHLLLAGGPAEPAVGVAQAGDADFQQALPGKCQVLGEPAPVALSGLEIVVWAVSGADAPGCTRLLQKSMVASPKECFATAFSLKVMP